MNAAPERTDIDKAVAEARRRRARNIAIAVALGVMVLLFYAVTIAKLGPGVLDRPM